MHYVTVFQTSYFSNGSLLWSLFYLTIGLSVAILFLTGRLRLKSQSGCATAFLLFWCAVWISFSSVWVFYNLRTASIFIEALRSEDCEVVQGTVAVLHEQPWGGHDSGDRILIDDVEFTINYYFSSLAYRRTISHGGHLTNGRLVRICHINGDILKIEVAGS